MQKEIATPVGFSDNFVELLNELEEFFRNERDEQFK